MLAAVRHARFILARRRRPPLPYIHLRRRDITLYGGPPTAASLEVFPSLELPEFDESGARISLTQRLPLLFPHLAARQTRFRPLLHLFPNTADNDEIDMVQRERLEYATLRLEIAREEKDIFEMCNAYVDYTSAALQLSALDPANIRLTASAIEDIVIPCMDVLSSSSEDSVKYIRECMREDLGSIWIRGVYFTMQNNPDWRPHTVVTLLCKHGAMGTAVDLARFIETEVQKETSDETRRWRLTVGTDVERSVRPRNVPAKRLKAKEISVLESYALPALPSNPRKKSRAYVYLTSLLDVGDAKGRSSLRVKTWDDVSMWRHKVIEIFDLVIHAHAGRDDFDGAVTTMKTAMALLEPAYLADLGRVLLTVLLDCAAVPEEVLKECLQLVDPLAPKSNTLRALLIRGYIILGHTKRIAEHRDALLHVNEPFDVMEHDARIEHAVAQGDTLRGWDLVKEMIQLSHMPRQRHIDALLALGDDAASQNSLSRIYRALNGPDVARRVAVAIEVYRVEVARDGHQTELLVPVLDALFPEGKSNSHGLKLALELSDEASKRILKTEALESSPADHASAGVKELCMEILLRAALETANFESVEALLTGASLSGTRIRPEFLNRIMETMITSEKDHKEAFMRLLVASSLWNEQLDWNRLFACFVGASYVRSPYPAADLALKFGDIWNPSEGLRKLLKRYTVVAMAGMVPPPWDNPAHPVIEGFVKEVDKHIHSLIEAEQGAATTSQKQTVLTSTSPVTIELINALIESYKSIGLTNSAVTIFRNLVAKDGRSYPVRLQPNYHSAALALQCISQMRNPGLAMDLWASLKEEPEFFELYGRQCWLPYLRCLIDCYVPLATSALPECPTGKNLTDELRDKYVRNARILLELANDCGHFDNMMQDIARFSPFVWTALMMKTRDPSEIPSLSDTYVRGPDTGVIPNWPSRNALLGLG